MASPFDPHHQNASLPAKIVAGLERVYEAYRVLLNEVGRSHGISPIQVQLLLFVQHHPGPFNTLSYLAQEFSLTKATLSQSVKTLHQKSLIAKENNPHDSRSQYLKLTPRGQQVVQGVQNFTTQLEHPIQQMSTPQQEQLWSGLQTVLISLQQQGAIHIQRMCFNCKWYQPRDGGHYCNLLKTPLEEKDIRIDCPEHSPTA